MAKEIIKNLSEVDGNMTSLKEFARYGVKLVALAKMILKWCVSGVMIPRLPT